MGRYVKDVDTTKNADDIKAAVESYLVAEGFENAQYNGQQCWKKGHGFIAPQYVMFEVTEGIVHLEGWIRFALLPGVYMGEMGTEGALGALPKRKLKVRMQELEKLLKD